MYAYISTDAGQAAGTLQSFAMHDFSPRRKLRAIARQLEPGTTMPLRSHSWKRSIPVSSGSTDAQRAGIRP